MNMQIPELIWKNIIYNVNNKPKRNFRRNYKWINQNKSTTKSNRELQRIKVKEKIREEPIFQMKTHRELVEEDCIGSHDV